MKRTPKRHSIALWAKVLSQAFGSVNERVWAEGRQEVSDVDWEGVLQVFVEFLGVEEGEGLQD